MSGSVRFRILSTAGVSWRARGVAAGTTTGRWQDKSAHGAARSVGCFYWDFSAIRQCAAPRRNVRETHNALPELAFPHIAGAGDD